MLKRVLLSSSKRSPLQSMCRHSRTILVLVATQAFTQVGATRSWLKPQSSLSQIYEFVALSYEALLMV